VRVSVVGMVELAVLAGKERGSLSAGVFVEWVRSAVDDAGDDVLRKMR